MTCSKHRIVSETIRSFIVQDLLQLQWTSSLQQLTAQHACNAKDSRNKQNEAARLRSGPAAGVDGECFRSNRSHTSLGGLRWAAVRHAPFAAILIPGDRVPAGN